MHQIVDIYELATILKASPHTLKKKWREFPHFFIGDGCTLKGARFDVAEVIEHLKKKSRYVGVERSKKKYLGYKIQIQKKAIQERRLQNEVEGTGMGSSETRGTRKTTGTGTERHEDKLPMNNKLYEVLKRQWHNRNKSTQYVFHNEDGSKLLYQQKRHTMPELCKKAGVKIFGFHAIRHHVASILADSGKAPLSQIQRMLRHKRPTTTDNYIQTLDPRLQQVASVLDEQGKFDEKKKRGTIGGTI